MIRGLWRGGDRPGTSQPDVADEEAAVLQLLLEGLSDEADGSTAQHEEKR